MSLLLASLLAAMTIVVMSPKPADAATKADYNLTYCYSSSTYRGSGANTLSNGTLRAGFCNYSAGGVGTATVKYSKTGGSAVTVQLGWEFVNSTGSTSSGRVLDSSFTIKSPRRGATAGITRAPAGTPPQATHRACAGS